MQTEHSENVVSANTASDEGNSLSKDEAIASAQSRKTTDLMVASVRFVILLLIYCSVFIAIQSSLDSAEQLHKATTINFAYRVF